MPKPEELSIKQLSKLQPPEGAVPLRGYLVREDEDQLWVQDKEATWLVSRGDVVGTSPWEGLKEGAQVFAGKPVLVLLREGAIIHELRPTRIQYHGRPITLMRPGDIPKVEGDEELKRLSEGWVRYLGFGPQDSVFRSARQVGTDHTACCWDSGGAVDCAADDCGWVCV